MIRRCAVLGDVHAHDGNLARALDAVSHLDVDLIACTGDVVDGFGSAARCCDLLRQHSVRCVRGNHDRWLFTDILRDRPKATRPDHLDVRQQEFIRMLPPLLEFPLDRGLMLLCHGIGANDLERITPLTTDYSIERNPALTRVRATQRYPLVVYGHTHERLVMHLDDIVLVNAGAVCHPGDPGFVVLDFEGNHVEWHRLSDDGGTPVERTVLFR